MFGYPIQNCFSWRPSGVRKSISRDLNTKEAAVWAAVAILLLVIGFQVHGIEMTNDSYHYLNVADNFRAGNGLTTSIIHFGSDRQTGAVPAPMVHYPVGYPLLIALISLLGLTIEEAGALLSGAGYVATLVLLWYGARLLDLGKVATRIMMLVALFNPVALRLGVSLMTETLFTALTMGAVLLVIKHEKASLGLPAFSDPRALIGANLLIGASYVVRYAGLFLFVAVFGYFLGKFLYDRSRSNAKALLTTSISLSFILATMLRNVVIADGWKAGLEREVYNGIGRVTDELIRCMYSVVFDASFKTLQATVVAGGILVIAPPLWALWRSRRILRPSPLLIFPILYLVIYAAALVYVCTFSVISTYARYLYPLLPVALLVATSLAQETFVRIRTTRIHYAFLAGIGILLISYGVGSRNILHASKNEPVHVRVQRWLGDGTASGLTVRQWLERRSSKDEMISAVRGHATSYVLGRPVLSFGSLNMSGQVWHERAVHEAMARYRARFLIIYRNINAVEYKDSPLLQYIRDGRIPAWLAVVMRTPNVIVLELQPSPMRASDSLPPTSRQRPLSRLNTTPPPRSAPPTGY
ncbi:MAG: hypothetical protein KIT09_23390 [Bryobacteraceae bacterium]|nr:hypothetical protein [Bryobacteraceae bacterium]